MSNTIDVLNEYGIRTGEVLSRKEIHAQGKLHRVIHLYLFNKNNDLLLQKRSPNADHYPNMFGISVTGHIDAGETSGQTVKRELQDELGLDPININIEFLFSFRQDAEISSDYIDRQFNDVYAAWADFDIHDITMQSSEVIDIKLVPFEQFKKMVENKDKSLAPVYDRETPDVIYFLQKIISQ